MLWIYSTPNGKVAPDTQCAEEHDATYHMLAPLVLHGYSDSGGYVSKSDSRFGFIDVLVPKNQILAIAGRK